MVIQILTREFPAPQERLISVSGSHYEPGILQRTVPEVDHQQNQLSKIDSNHPLQPLILNCLKDREIECSSAQQICSCIAALKENPEYNESIQVTSKEKETEIQLLKLQHAQQVQSLQDTIQQQANRLEEKYQIIADKEEIIKQKEEIITEKETDIVQKDKAIAAEQQNTQQLKKRYKELEQKIVQMESRSREQLQQLQCRSRADSKSGIRFKWREGKSAPSAMYRYNDACPNGRKVYFRDSNHIYAYDSTNCSWSQLPDCPYSDCSLVIIKTLLTTVGGFDHRLKIANKLFSLTGDDKGQNWNDVFPPMPTKCEYAAALSTGSYLIVAGG